MSGSNWIEVDRAGLAQVVADRPKSFILFELIQNALDENGVSRVDVSLTPAGRGLHEIVVSDDAPDGYADIRHAWTLYAPSKKKGDPTKRGRFNSGCKTVLALAKSAIVVSTKSAVEFDPNEGRRLLRRRSSVGTVFTGVFPLTLDEAKEAVVAARRMLPPIGVDLRVDGELVPYRGPRNVVEATLPTIASDEEGVLRPTKRKTNVAIHRPLAGETPTLFEMGIPVVELDGGFPFHVDVQQRVPLNQDRDNVTPAYLRKLRVAVLNEVHDSLDHEQASAAWVSDASGHEDASPAAVDSVLTGRFGERRVVYDPSDPEGSKLAMSKGYTVIPGGSLSGAQWRNVRRFGTALPAGQVTPSPKVETSPDGVPAIPRAKWKPEWAEIEQLAEWLWHLLRPTGAPSEIDVVWYDGDVGFAGAFKSVGRRRIMLNARALRSEIAAWATGDKRGILALLVHEFGHEYESDHLSERYHDALCRMAAEAFYITVPGDRPTVTIPE